MAKMYLTATDIYRYFQCPHWPYYDRYATEEERRYARKQTDAEIHRQEDGVAHEERIVSELLKQQTIVTAVREVDPIAACAATVELMRQGVPWIYQGTLTYGDWTGRPDLLERREGASDVGDWHYVPIDVKTSSSIQKYQKMQLAFYARLLKDVQGRLPEVAGILNRQGVCLSFDVASIQEEFTRIIEDLTQIVLHGKKPELVLRKSCYDVGVWGRLCEKNAKDVDDIALLYKVDVQKLKALRTLNICTIDDAARIDPSAIAGQMKGLTLHALDVIVHQAQSLKDKTVHIREPIALPRKPLEIHFDIESDPPNDVDYLYGVLIRTDAGDTYKAFIAKKLEDEKAMWQSFLAWIETLPSEFVVYHFSPYELSRLITMERRYGGSEWLERFRANMVDLKEYSSSHVTFPLYFYGLKYIAKFLGFEWRGALISNGGESVDQFETYLETGDQTILDAILMYNEDDVRATAHLKDWMVAYAKDARVYPAPYPWSKR